MYRKKEKSGSQDLGVSLDDLRGKQSVRVTFRLPQQVIDLLSVMAAQLGIKQKSLFDQLVEDIAVLGQVAREARSFSASAGDRRQKTFVISRSSLVSLEVTARNQQISRDILVEQSIKRLLPVIESELKKHEKRKVLLKEYQEYLGRGKKLLKKTGSLLGKEDQFYEMIAHQVNICEKNVSLLSSIVEKGKPMEDW